MPRIILINPSTRDAKGATSISLAVPPLGLASLAAVLEKQGHEVTLIDAHLLGLSPSGVVSGILDPPDMVGLSANILSLKYALECAKEIRKKYPDTKIILGGPHPSSVPQHILKMSSYIDAVVVGEGEITLKELADNMHKPDLFFGVAGVVYRHEGKIIDNGPRELVEDLDELPLPAYHLLSHISRYKTRSRLSPVGYILTSRGCPSACTFCFRTFGTKWRVRSPENIMEEIKLLVKNYGIRQLDVMDDNFCYNKERAHKMLDMIIESNLKLAINFQVGVRVSSVDREMLVKMKKAGGFKVGFGIESGDPDVLKRIKKGLNLNKALEIVKIAREVGLVTHSFFIIGFPGESPESMRRTIDFAKKLNTHFASFSMFAPLPGTELYDEVVAHGKLLEDTTSGISEGLFAMKPFFQYGNVPPELTSKYCEMAWREFYRRPSKMLDVMTSIGSASELMWVLRGICEAIKIKTSK